MQIFISQIFKVNLLINIVIHIVNFFLLVYMNTLGMKNCSWVKNLLDIPHFQLEVV